MDEPTTEQITAIRKAAAQAALGQSDDHNPYPPGSKPAAIWDRHYFLALTARNE